MAVQVRPWSAAPRAYRRGRGGAVVPLRRRRRLRWRGLDPRVAAPAVVASALVGWCAAFSWAAGWIHAPLALSLLGAAAAGALAAAGPGMARRG